MLLKTLAVFTAVTLTVQASAGSSSSKISEDLNPFQDLNLAIKRQQEAMDDNDDPFHQQTVKLSLEWRLYYPLSPLVTQSLTGVVRLNLGTFLASIPPEISLMKNLKDLSLSVSTWDALPESLGTMDHLTRLSVAHSQIGRIPAFLRQLTNLTNLSYHCSTMNFESIEAAHDFFRAFPYLTSLHLGEPGEHCAVIPKGIAHLESLKSLSHANEKTLKAPGFDIDSYYFNYQINNFKALQAFLKEQDCEYGREDWNGFQKEWQEEDKEERSKFETGEPRPLADASTLGAIHLEHLKDLPKALYRFRNLRSLTAQSWLTKIPDGIAALEHLEELELSLLDADSLPSDLGALKNLEKLELNHMRNGDYLQHTGLTRLTQLQELNLQYSHTNIDLTPLLALTQLRKLDLGSTDENVPKVIGQLTSLQKLDSHSARLPGHETPEWGYFCGDKLERALAYIRSDAYDPDAELVKDDSDYSSDDESYDGKGKEKSKKTKAGSSSGGSSAAASSDKIDKDDMETPLKDLTVQSILLETPQAFESIQYALAALNGLALTAHQNPHIDLEHHLKMCENLVKLAQHFKKES